MKTKTVKFALVCLSLMLLGCPVIPDTLTLNFGSDKTTETFTLTVQNPVAWSISCGQPWVMVSPDNGLGEGTYSIAVTVDRGGLENGLYTAILQTSTDSPFPCADVLVTMSVIKPPEPREGISLYNPDDKDTWYAGTNRTIEWVAAEEIKEDMVQITITGDNDSIPILDVETENTGSYKINSFGKGTLDDHTLWTAPLLNGRITITVSNNDNVWRDEVELVFPITLGILSKKIIAARGTVDSDRDRLPDSIEDFIGTDPYNSNSDGDGIRDYNEIFGFGYFNDSAPLPDTNDDGIIDACDKDSNDKDLVDWLNNDNDGDGIPNYLEYYGYTYDWMGDTYELWDGEYIDQPYFKTDPLQPSTDQDPYSDAMEVSGGLMDVVVGSPGDLPMVPAYPNIVVRLEGYDVTLNAEVTYTEGGSIAEETSWSRQTSSQHSGQWSVQGSTTHTIKLSKDGGYEGSVTIGGGFGETNTTSYAESTGGSITNEYNWQKATSANPSMAARIKLNLKVYNYGTAAASNVLPTLTLKIGAMNVLTFKPANPIDILVPGGVYPPQQGTYLVVDKIEMDSEPNLYLTIEELRALECGAPVSIAVNQIASDVMLLNEGGQWENAGKWGEYMARCEAVCSNIYLDAGDGRSIHYLVYADDSLTSPRVTFGDALTWIAGAHTRDDGPYITYYDVFDMEELTLPLDGFHFSIDNETLDRNGWVVNNNGLTHPSGDGFDINDMVLGPRSVVVGKVSREVVNKTQPTAHYAYYDSQLEEAVVLVSDYIGIDQVVLSNGSDLVSMNEFIKGSGYYKLENLKSQFSGGCYEGQCMAFVTNVNRETVTATLACLEYPKDEPDKPQILTVSIKSTQDGEPLREVVTISVKVQGTEEWPVTNVWVYDPANPTTEIKLDNDLDYWSGGPNHWFKKIASMTYAELSELVIVAECCESPLTDLNCYDTYKVNVRDIDAESLDHGEGVLENRLEFYGIGYKAFYSYINFYESIDPAGGYDFCHQGTASTGWNDSHSDDDALRDHGDGEIFMFGKGDCAYDIFHLKHQTYFAVNANWIDVNWNYGSLWTKTERMTNYDSYNAEWIANYLNDRGLIFPPYRDALTLLLLPHKSGCEEYRENQFHIVVFEIPDTTYVVKFMFYEYSLGHDLNYTNTVKYMYDVYNIGN